MNDPTLEVLASRLARLERASQRWRRLATIAFLGLTVVLLTGQVRSRPAPIETTAGNKSAWPNPQTVPGKRKSQSDRTSRKSSCPTARPASPHNTILCLPNVVPQSRKIHRQPKAVTA